MNGQVKITEIKESPLVWKEKGNELIKRLNIPWEVKMPDENTQWGIGQFQYSDQKILLDLSQLSTIEFVGCDENGNQFTFVALGFRKEDL